tara:strand:+ start:22095 stop:22835 length:741 start_codon:yes stop_codon:yes gene_type:complete
MKISIITVCYNSGKTIEDTIKSVISQTHKNVEYIIIDGESTDNTLAIIDKYKNNVSKFISEPDKGLYDAMNKGISLSTGNIIGLLNSDDVFAGITVLEEIAEFHNTHQIEASVGNIVQTKEGKIIRTFNSKNWNPEKLTKGFMPPHPSIFFTSTILQQLGGYKTNYKIAADYELIIRYFLKNKIIWKYSGITTTSMAVGGVSSSGASSYRLITSEIGKAFNENKISYSPTRVKLRGFIKIIELLKL